MEYAVFETGGKQYVASEGQVITVDKIDTKEGENIKFEKILLIRKKDWLFIGDPIVKGAIVSGKILKQYKGDKIHVMKFKAKVRYRRRIGFRPHQTDVKIEKIIGVENSAKPKKAVKKNLS